MCVRGEVGDGLDREIFTIQDAWKSEDFFQHALNTKECLLMKS